MRHNRFELRFSDDEYKMLSELSEYQGVSRADVMRQLVRKKHRKIQAEFYNPEDMVKCTTCDGQGDDMVHGRICCHCGGRGKVKKT